MAKRRKKKKQNHIHVYVVLLVVAVLLALAIRTERKANTDEVDLETYFASASGNFAVVRDFELSHEDMFAENSRVFVSAEYLTGKLNSRFFFDAKDAKLLYTLPEETLTVDKTTQYEGAAVLKERDGKYYVMLAYAAQYTDLGWEYFSKPDRLVLHTNHENYQSIILGESAVVRQGAGTEHPIMTTLAAGSKAAMLDESSSWVYICTDDGIHGYVARDKILGFQTEKYVSTYTEPEYKTVTDRQGIGLAWHRVGKLEDNAKLEELAQTAQGMNVISPTWLHASDGKGSLISFAEEDYVTRAHALGLDVWVLVENTDNQITGDTLTELLNTGSSRAALVKNILEETVRVGADGINVDFENVPVKAGPAYVQFLRELCVQGHELGLVMSVDNYVPSSWTAHYDRREQGIFADYVIIMGYDEHYKGSDAGSTASLSFVTQGIADTLAQVPANKVINAVPFYTRLWQGMGDTLNSAPLAINAVDEYIVQYNLSPIWDETVGQNYAEFTMDGALARIWFEDASSMRTRLLAMSEYKLAGVAAWRLGMEDAETWQLIRDYLGGTLSDVTES